MSERNALWSRSPQPAMASTGSPRWDHAPTLAPTRFRLAVIPVFFASLATQDDVRYSDFEIRLCSRRGSLPSENRQPRHSNHQTGNNKVPLTWGATIKSSIEGLQGYLLVWEPVSCYPPVVFATVCPGKDITL